MSIERKLIGTADGVAYTPTYIEDVFSTYLYTGTGASQTINNGIDLATKGGLVWLKGRSGATDHALYDTTRGATFDLTSTSTAAQTTQSTGLTAFGTTGFTIGALAKLNTSAATYASWTFRKQAKFFDVVTYTGTGSARTIAHALGATPGMIIVKRTDTTGNWQVYHNGLTSAANSIQLNLTAAQASATTVWNSTAPTSSVFSVGTDATVNASGGTYVAYLFAASNSGGFGSAGTDSVVACGSFTGASTVNLGWEPQFVLMKPTSVDNWIIFDTMRGMSLAGASNSLMPNLSTAEGSEGTGAIYPTSTGFSISSAVFGTSTVIYLAIRRGPMKTPTDATKVFAVNSTNAINTNITSGFPADLAIVKSRGGTNGYVGARIIGNNAYLTADATTAQASYAGGWKFDLSGQFLQNQIGTTPVTWMMGRAPGFFDVVCYTGTGTIRTQTHGLTVAPELIIIKNRSVLDNWAVYHPSIGNTNQLNLNADYAAYSSDRWNNTSPTASVFSLGINNEINASAKDYVAYLFATCPGVSKVGSYTGNGTSQTIGCGFAAGARFVLIKRTDATGNWTVWDTARGIVAGNDPHLSLNTTAAEVTTNDTIDPDSSGFIVNQVTATNVNVSSATYIYLAIA